MDHESHPAWLREAPDQRIALDDLDECALFAFKPLPPLFEADITGGVGGFRISDVSSWNSTVFRIG